MKLVIFDCDGTLVDSQNAIYGAMEYAFAGMGLTVPTRPQVLSIVGLSLPQAFEALVPRASVSVRRELAERYKGAFPVKRSEVAERETLYPGAKEVVEALAARGDVVLGIATGKSRRGVARLFDQEGWHDLFATVQTADDHPSKPNPAMIQAALDETGAQATATVMIGDTTYDIDMGRNAGVATLGVAWGYHELEELTAAGAHEIVHRFVDVPESIDRLFGMVERAR